MAYATKEKERAYQRAYYARNKEKMRALKRKWYLEHRVGILRVAAIRYAAKRRAA